MTNPAEIFSSLRAPEGAVMQLIITKKTNPNINKGLAKNGVKIY